MRRSAAVQAGIQLRPVPISMPAAMRWPGTRVQRTIPVDQPPLPWLDLGADPPGLILDRLDEGHRTAETGRREQAGGTDPLTDLLTGRRSRTGSVRIVRFGDSWAGPLADDLPDPGAWSAALAVAISEVLRGARPVSQLNRWLSPPALTQLTTRAAQQNPHHNSHQNPTRDRPGSRTPPVLQSVHLQRSGPDVVEVVALFAEHRAPVTALAFRLDSLADRWLCTAVETRTGAVGLSRPT